MNERLKRVLIADDDDSIRALVSRVLRRAGFETVEAEDGQYAIDRLVTAPFDAVVVDLMMPRVDGFGVVNHLIAQQPDMVEKTVVVTAFPQAAVRERLHDLCAVLSKPFDVRELLATVEKCVGK